MGEQKVVWITGASSGIGEALAKAYAAKGYRLVLSSRRENELVRVKNSCNLTDEAILVLPLDLAHHDGMDEKAKKVIDHFGRIDILINNGGISQRSLVMDTDMAVYKKLLDIDYLGTVAVTKAVLPYFVKQRSGHVATITSLMGKFASPFRSGYCGAKHALHGFFDSLRLEHDADNIKVTLICPGYINTNISQNSVRGDGSKHNKMDEGQAQGMSPAQCAARIIKAIDKQKFEVAIGGMETIGITLKRFFPRFLHRYVLKNTRKQMEELKASAKV